MIPQKPENERHLIDWLIAALGVVLAVLLFFFVRQYQVLRREEIISARESWIADVLKNHHSISDVSIISPWMTFDYVDKLFNLPPAYLKSQLSVADPAYPNLTLGKFSKGIGQDVSSTVEEIRNAVQNYLATQPPANTSST